MSTRLTLAAALAATLLAGAAEAQVLRRGAAPLAGAPPGTPPAEAEIWPFPPPDPKSWWDDKRPAAPEAADPLGRRRLGRGERLPAIDSGIDASTYRLWGLMPLQWQVLRGDEVVFEVWVRPSGSVRQSVVRVTVRRDGEAFVSARAGLACCEAGIARRVGFDRKLPAGAAARFLALRAHPLWSAPREVRVREGGGAAEAVCVNGTSYDLTLLEAGRARAVRRACDSVEIGQAADVLEALMQAALGHEPRFDVIYPRGASFASERRMYEDLLQTGGRLTADTNRAPAPGSEPAPVPQDPAPPAPEAASPGRV